MMNAEQNVCSGDWEPSRIAGDCLCLGLAGEDVDRSVLLIYWSRIV